MSWQNWVNLILGLWVIAMPWALGFASMAGAMWTSVITGIVIAVVAGLALNEERSKNTSKS